MKIAPLYHALAKEAWADPIIVHTGQHYDLNMSDVFFQDLELPEPHIHLGIGSGSHAEQTGQVMIAYEKKLLQTKPDLVIVVGDVNSTIACTLAAAKISYPAGESYFGTISTNPKNTTAIGYSENRRRTTDNGRGHRPLVAHLEAGLRSCDRTMPEEINRILTDAISDILWTPSPDGDENLIIEGVTSEKIERVGNIMIDSLELVRSKIEQESVYREYGLEPQNYAVITLHRPSNVDDPEILKKLIATLVKQSEKIPMIFPVHPRTWKNIEQSNLNGDLGKAPNLKILKPQNYRRFMNLIFNCRLAITDSGGIQEETTYLGIPCLTLRPNTERPVTLTQGTNQLCTADQLEEKTNQILAGPTRKPSAIDLWDGLTATRVVQSIRKQFHL